MPSAGKGPEHGPCFFIVLWLSHELPVKTHQGVHGHGGKGGIEFRTLQIAVHLLSGKGLHHLFRFGEAADLPDVLGPCDHAHPGLFKNLAPVGRLGGKYNDGAQVPEHFHQFSVNVGTLIHCTASLWLLFAYRIDYNPEHREKHARYGPDLP